MDTGLSVASHHLGFGVMSSSAIIIPLKSFAQAKSRLRVEGLDAGRIARELAQGVIEAAAPLPRFVVSEDPAVLVFAEKLGANSIPVAVVGLNESVTVAYQALGTQFDRVIVVHGDLFFPAGINELGDEDDALLVTDHHGTGTNILALPTGLDFEFAYGPDSRAAHCAEVQRHGLSLREIVAGPWTFDVDEPSDFFRP